MSERIFPSNDLHLLPGAPATPLAVFASIDGSWTGFATQPGYALTLIPTVPAPSTTPIVALHGTTLVAVHEGEQLAVLRVSVAAPNPQSWDLALRVTVHHELRQLYAATDKLTLETGRTDRVLTVYGRFADVHGNLSTHDITRHVYLKYDVVSLTGDANAVQVDATGRVTTGSSPGTARVTISSGAATTSVEITVVAFQDDRPILVQRWRGSAFRKRSIVLISEGFTTADQSRFEKLAGELAIGFVVDTPPYDLLRESFDIYSVFIPSPESGISIGPPVVPVWGNTPYSLPVPTLINVSNAADYSLDELVRTLGDPASNQLDFAHASQQLNQNGRVLTQTMFDVWHSLSPLAPQMRVHDTNIGLIMGERHYGTATELQPVQQPPGPTLDVGLTFLLPLIADRTPMFDDRRLPDLTTSTVDPEHAHLEAQDRFVRTLRAPDGPTGFGATWAQGGDSFGLVIYVANCDHFGGLHQNGYVGMSVGGNVLVQQVPSLIDGLFDVFPVPRPLPPEWKAAGIERPAGSIVNVLTHEIGHTEAIGHLDDEYGSDVPRQSPDAQAIENIATYPNTQVLANAIDGTAISATKLKWNWHRLEAAGEIESIVTQGQQVMITLNIEDWQRWPAHTVGRTVFLRVRSATLVEGVPLSEPLVIHEVNDADQTIALDVPLGNVPDALVTVFSAHGIIVLPRVDANNEPLRLVDPSVIAALAHGPFEATTNCVPAAQKGPPATIANYDFPADHNTVIAAYETAGQFDCGVIRPTADCKMRQAGDMATGKPVDFCFVCRYIIVDAIDPASHGELDQQAYPRAPRR